MPRMSGLVTVSFCFSVGKLLICGNIPLWQYVTNLLLLVLHPSLDSSFVFLTLSWFNLSW